MSTCSLLWNTLQLCIYPGKDTTAALISETDDEEWYSSPSIPNVKICNVPFSEGGYGQVFHCKVYNVKFDWVAKQVHIRRDLHWHQFDRSAVEREVSVLERLNHPNIVKCYGCEFLDSVANIYLSFGGVSDLVTWSDSRRSYDSKARIHVMRQVVSAIEYLHSSSVVHGDIKLDNILITPRTDVVTLVDFGGCREVHRPVRLPVQRGTITYMAPELIRDASKAPAFASDMWSLGISYFAMCFKIFPFKFASVEDALYRKQLRRDSELRDIQSMLNEDDDQTHVLAGEMSVMNNVLKVHPMRRISARAAMHCLDEAD